MNSEGNLINLAIFSPAQNAYSETFIQAHRELPFNCKFYFGGFLPTQLENAENLYDFTIKEKLLIRVNKQLSLSEHTLSFSLQKQKINCVLAEYAPTACHSLNVLKNLHIPLVVHFHGFDATNPETLKTYKNQYPEMFQYAKKILVVSEKMKADVVQLGCDSAKIIVTSCGPHPSFFNNVPLYNTEQFLGVSRFVDIKGIIYTISAFKKVVEKFPGAKLVLVGDGPTLESCKQLVQALKINESVIFKGVLATEAIRQLMIDSIAFVQHSITLDGGITEGAPVSIMEGQAAALPVVSSGTGGIPEIVIDNATGFLVNEKDVNEMATAMMNLLSDKTLAADMGKKGRQTIIENFSREKHLRQIQTAIQLAVMA